MRTNSFIMPEETEKEIPLKLRVICSTTFMEQMDHLGAINPSGAFKWRFTVPTGYPETQNPYS